MIASMYFPLFRAFSAFIKGFLVLGFVFIQLVYTLIVGVGWPFIMFSSLGGCMMETHGYGWPLAFYEVTTSCGVCCDGVSVPFTFFNLNYLMTDVIYLVGLALICFYTAKYAHYVSRRATNLFRR